MCSGQRRWQRSHQGTDLQENSECPRKSWRGFPEGETELGADWEVQDSMEKANQQHSEGLVWLCRETALNHLWLFPKQGGSSEFREMEPFIHKTTPMQKNSEAEQTKNHKTWENLEENPLKKQQEGGKPRRIWTQNLSKGKWGRGCSLPGTAPAHILILPKWWGINSLVPHPSGLSSRHSLDQRLCYLQQRKFPCWFPSPLFNQNEEKLSQGRNKIKSSYRTAPFKFFFRWVSHRPTLYIFLYYNPVSVV